MLMHEQNSSKLEQGDRTRELKKKVKVKVEATAKGGVGFEDGGGYDVRRRAPDKGRAYRQAAAQRSAAKLVQSAWFALQLH